MDPVRLQIENFMGHRLTDIDCTLFNSVLIVGKSKNDDQFSNGAGKSTIFKAIEFVLFGEYETKTIDKIVRRGQERARITFDFSISNQIFRIQRTRNSKSGKSDLRMWEKRSDAWVDITQKTATGSEQELAKLIKITYPAFKNSVLFARGDIEGLSSTKSPEKRKAILKEALSLMDYSKFEKAAKEEASNFNKKIVAQKAIINSIGKPDEEISEFKNKLKIIKHELSSREKERDDLRAQLSERRIHLSDNQLLLTSEATGSQQKLQNLIASKNQIEKDIQTSKNTVDQKQQHIKSVENDTAKKDILLQQLQQNLLGTKNKSFRASEAVLKELDNINNNISNGKSYVFSIENKIKELKQPLPDGDICPHCRQTMSPEHKTECAKKIKQDLSNLQLDLIESKKKLEIINTKKSKLDIELREIQEHKNIIVRQEALIENKKIEIGNDQNYSNQLSEIITQITIETDKYIDKLSAANSEILLLEKQIQQVNINEINENILQAKKDIESFERKIQMIINSISNTNTQIGILTEKLNSRQKDNVKLSSLSVELKELEKTYQMWQMVVQGFSSGGIPTMIIYTILDDLQIEANKLLSELRPGFEMQFSVIKDKNDGQQEDTLEITYRLHGEEFEYEELSDGQRLMVSVCLRIGLSLVIQHRLGVDIKFLELDEVDEKFDKAAVIAFTAMIKRLQDKFKIFVITHNDALKDKFSHAILVEYDKNNGSTATVVSSW